MSWYSYPPVACYDAGRRTAVPRGITAWIASRSLPCGTLVTLTGLAGSITAPVMDRGPWVAGRLFDASPTVFRAVAGSLRAGVVRVSWRLAG